MSAAGNLTIDVRGKDHHGDMTIAAALALFSCNQLGGGGVGVQKITGWR